MQPKIDNRDWSSLSLGRRLGQIQVQGFAALPQPTKPFFADPNTRHWDFCGANKPPRMARQAPGMNPSRWQDP